MPGPLNCNECRMEERCSCKAEDCKYPEGRAYGVTTYDKIREDNKTALEKEVDLLRCQLDVAMEGLKCVNGLAVDHPDKSDFMSGVMSGRKDAINIASATIAKVEGMK